MVKFPLPPQKPDEVSKKLSKSLVMLLNRSMSNINLLVNMTLQLRYVSFIIEAGGASGTAAVSAR